MKIKCWVVWWKGDDPGPCEGVDGPLLFRSRKLALAEARAIRLFKRDHCYSVRPAVLEVPDAT